MSTSAHSSPFSRLSHVAAPLAAALFLLALCPPAVAQNEKPAGPVFVLSAGDVVEVKFFNNPELNDTLQIRPDGIVSFPVIGEVKFAGRAVSEVVKEIRERYTPTLAKPELSINVKTYARRKVFVSGEVNRPGAISIPGDMTILEAIVEAGGVKLTGSRNVIYLIRRGNDGNPTMQEISLAVPGGKTASPPIPAAKNLLRAASTPLEPFDVILVPESGVSKANRWIDQHIRQMVPVFLTAGFSYLFNPIVLR
jgi:polysaccharide biosynthesis/export protein